MEILLERLDNDNGESASLLFWLGAGSDYTSGTLATSWNHIWCSSN